MHYLTGQCPCFKVKVYDQIVFTKDCLGCNRLCHADSVVGITVGHFFVCVGP